MEPKRVFSGAPWEKSISYCRAIRSGPFVAVSGTTSMKNGEVFAPGDPYLQTLRCFEIIEEALASFGLNLSHVVRTRMFVTDISQWESYGKAHGEFFKDHPPAASMLEVKALIRPELLVEVEVDAIAP
jgi:enamine deaminase RidA (YjgF/YER057c/UK114 family)